MIYLLEMLSNWNLYNKYQNFQMFMHFKLILFLYPVLADLLVSMIFYSMFYKTSILSMWIS
jgi:hypothetical protein